MSLFLPDPESRPQWWRRLLWVVVLLALVAGLLLAPSAYERLKLRRAQAMAELARSHLERKDYNAAVETAQSALHLNPANAEALRVLARVFTEFRREEAFSLWETLWRGQPPPQAERDTLIDLALLLRRWDKAEQYLIQALRDTPDRPATLRQAAHFFEQRGQAAQSIAACRTYLAQAPHDEEIRLLLARQLLQMTNATEQAQAREILRQLSTSTNQGTVLVAIGFWSSAREMTLEDVQYCRERLQLLPPGVTRDFLLQDLALRLAPQRREEIIAETIKKFQSGGEDHLLALARWLNGRGEYLRVLEVLPEPVAFKNQDFFLVFCDAIAGLSDWLRLQTLLANDKVPLPGWLRELYRARVATELGRDNQAVAHWDQAQSQAANLPDALQYLGEYAEKIGAVAEAARAYRRLATFPTHTRRAYLALIKLYENRGDTAKLRRLMQDMVKLYPDDEAPQNDLAYLELLLEINLEGARQVAESLVAKRPDMMAYRTTLALAHLRRKDYAGLRAAYQKSTLVWDQALPGWQAVYVAALGALGETNLARQLAPTVPLTRLKPEERELLRPWL
jgi:tetratricopeptide (TPR) repeat protein